MGIRDACYSVYGYSHRFHIIVVCIQPVLYHASNTVWTCDTIVSTIWSSYDILMNEVGGGILADSQGCVRLHVGYTCTCT